MIYKTEIYFFSGTGNSYYISKQVAKNLENTKLINIGKLNFSNTKKITTNAENIGIIFPVYYGSSPDIVKQFIQNLSAKNCKYLFVICNYGAVSGGTLSHIENLLSKHELTTNLTYGITLPDNSIIFPTNPSRISQYLEIGDKEIKKVGEMIAKKENYKEKTPLISPSFINAGIKFYAEKHLGFKDLRVNINKCINCEICEKVCPRTNITCKNNTVKFSNKCESCFSCIHRCPKQAITFKKMKKLNNYQYVHPKVSMEEYISSIK